jgi:plastocyanin
LLGVESRAQQPHRAHPKATDDSGLTQELLEQRQLLMKLIQIQQANLDLLTKLLVKEGKVDPETAARLTAPVPSADSTSRPVPVSEAEPPVRPEPRRAPTARQASAGSPPAKPGSVVGTVSVEGGRADDAYVYVDHLRGTAPRDASFTIKQVNKQFSPQLAAVERGTRVNFPNLDSVFHNAFSLSAGNAFDLGIYHAGDETKSVLLLHPGVVQVFCNMHSQMNATVLVVPNGLFTKVHADGQFTLEGVPSGRRELVAWIANGDAQAQDVEIASGQASQISFALKAGGKPPFHTNKLGQPYGSYQE